MIYVFVFNVGFFFEKNKPSPVHHHMKKRSFYDYSYFFSFLEELFFDLLNDYQEILGFLQNKKNKTKTKQKQKSIKKGGFCPQHPSPLLSSPTFPLLPFPLFPFHLPSFFPLSPLVPHLSPPKDHAQPKCVFPTPPSPPTK